MRVFLPRPRTLKSSFGRGGSFVVVGVDSFFEVDFEFVEVVNVCCPMR